MKKKVILEIDISYAKEEIIFDMVFLDTGEIRQKRRSFEWLMRRVFLHELRTCKKRGEIVEYDGWEER